jgi:hypothetical protein
MVGLICSDTLTSTADRYSIGVELRSGRYYLSIPVSSGVVDYEEYYELTEDQYRQFLADKELTIEFAEACRRRERDELLLQRPGSNRGTPV